MLFCFRMPEIEKKDSIFLYSYPICRILLIFLNISQNVHSFSLTYVFFVFIIVYEYITDKREICSRSIVN